ncbi:MAG: PAS domain-containing protein [Oscillochloris sp.]|nr:PAS domain-containing protein [Oscillochloris sp.]
MTTTRPTQVLRQVLDITARKKAEMQLAVAFARLEQLNADLQHSSNLLHTIINSLEDCLALLDVQGRLLMVNRAFSELCRSDAAALIGCNWDAIDPFGIELMRPEIREGKSFTSREQLERDGFRRFFDLQVIPLTPFLHAEYQIVLYLTDVTEQLQLQELNVRSERLAAMGRLAATVAHEVNSPLQAIQNFLFLAANDNPQERDGSLNMIAEEIDRIGGLIRRLLELQRPGDDTIRRLDMNTLIERVLRLTTSTLNRYQVQISLQLSRQPVIVMGHSNQFTQVLLNLIMNAIDAMPNGGTLTIRSKRRSLRREDKLPRPLPARVVEIEVSDTGAGIPAEAFPLLFEAFYTTKPYGTGLGLATSRQIVEQLGGCMTVCNLEGGGAAFTILLPTLE